MTIEFSVEEAVQIVAFNEHDFAERYFGGVEGFKDVDAHTLFSTDIAIWKDPKSAERSNIWDRLRSLDIWPRARSPHDRLARKFGRYSYSQANRQPETTIAEIGNSRLTCFAENNSVGLTWWIPFEDSTWSSSDKAEETLRLGISALDHIADKYLTEDQLKKGFRSRVADVIAELRGVSLYGVVHMKVVEGLSFEAMGERLNVSPVKVPAILYCCSRLLHDIDRWEDQIQLLELCRLPRAQFSTSRVRDICASDSSLTISVEHEPSKLSRISMATAGESSQTLADVVRHLCSDTVHIENPIDFFESRSETRHLHQMRQVGFEAVILPTRVTHPLDRHDCFMRFKIQKFTLDVVGSATVVWLTLDDTFWDREVHGSQSKPVPQRAYIRAILQSPDCLIVLDAVPVEKSEAVC
jgi:hypothetical protein